VPQLCNAQKRDILGSPTAAAAAQMTEIGNNKSMLRLESFLFVLLMMMMDHESIEMEM
jgi:hypothetical protein